MCRSSPLFFNLLEDFLYGTQRVGIFRFETMCDARIVGGVDDAAEMKLLGPTAGLQQEIPDSHLVEPADCRSPREFFGSNRTAGNRMHSGAAGRPCNRIHIVFIARSFDPVGGPCSFFSFPIEFPTVQTAIRRSVFHILVFPVRKKRIAFRIDESGRKIGGGISIPTGRRENVTASCVTDR